MKLNSKVSNNYKKYYKEARCIAFNKMNILNKGMVKKSNYFFVQFLNILNDILIVILMFSLCTILNNYVIFYLILVYYVISYSMSFCLFLYRKNKGFNNEWEFTKEGLVDKSFFGIRFLFKWDSLKGIVEGDNVIVILTNSMIYFFMNKEVKDDLVKILDKYNKNDLMIK